MSTTARTPLLALLAAGGIAQLGNSFSLVAIPWFVIETTGSASKTGMVGATATGALVLAAVFGGSVVDRIGFKRISVISDLANGISLLGIPLLYQTIGLEFWQLLVLVLLGTILDTPGRVARQSLFPDLVEQGGYRLERANAVSQGIWRLATLIGPLVAGVLISLLGAVTMFWIIGASFVIPAILIGVFIPHAVSNVTDGERASLRSVLSDLPHGFRIIRQDSLITVLAVVSTMGNAIGAAITVVILPVYVSQTFGDAAVLGLALGGFGAGAMMSVIAFGMVGYRYSRRTSLLVSRLMSLAPVWVLFFSPPLAVLVAAQVLDGLSTGPFGPIVTTAYQKRVPSESRGRFFSTILALDNISTPFAILITGFLLDFVAFELVIAGVGLLGIVVFVYCISQPALFDLDCL